MRPESGAIYQYQNALLPPFPTRAEDRPEYDEEFVSAVRKAQLDLSPLSTDERTEMRELFRKWRSARPAMWGRLTRAKLAKQFARICLQEPFLANELAPSETPHFELPADVRDTSWGEEWWHISEYRDYEDELEDWRHRVSVMRLDPSEVLAFLRGEQREWEDQDSEREDELFATADGAARVLLGCPVLATKHIRLLADFLDMLIVAPVWPTDRSIEILIHSNGRSSKVVGWVGFQMKIDPDGLRLAWGSQLAAEDDPVDNSSFATLSSKRVYSGQLDLEKWLSDLSAVLERRGDVTFYDTPIAPRSVDTSPR